MSAHCKNAIIFLNGTPPSKKLVSLLGNLWDYYTVCTDGAYKYASEFSEIDLLLGDFDSLDLPKACVSENTEIMRYKVEKNFTDGYLAVKECAKRGVNSVVILGAFGGRPDHECCNYSLLPLCRELNMNARIAGEDYDVYFVDDKINLKMRIGATVSVVPFSDKAHIFYTKGLKYPSDGYTYDKLNNLSADDLIMGVSNQAEKEDVEIALSGGKVLVFAER